MADDRSHHAGKRHPELGPTQRRARRSVRCPADSSYRSRLLNFAPEWGVEGAASSVRWMSWVPNRSELGTQLACANPNVDASDLRVWTNPAFCGPNAAQYEPTRDRHRAGDPGTWRGETAGQGPVQRHQHMISKRRRPGRTTPEPTSTVQADGHRRVTRSTAAAVRLPAPPVDQVQPRTMAAEGYGPRRQPSSGHLSIPDAVFKTPHDRAGDQCERSVGRDLPDACPGVTKLR